MTTPPTMGPVVTTSDLVTPEKAEIGLQKGIGPLDTANELINDISNVGKKQATGEYDQSRQILELATDGVCLTLDALGVVMNPLGELGKAGAGFLIEHISFVREGLEVITGDPEEVKAIAKSWEEIAKRLRDTADEYQHALTGVPDWSGAAADGYRGVAAHYIDSLNAASKHAEGAKECVENAGLAVATVRGLVFDIIAELVGRLIGQALAALASAVFTVGASAAAFIAGAVAQACTAATRITARLRKLVAAMEKFSEILKRFSEAAKKYQSISASRTLIDDAAQPITTTLNKWGEIGTKHVGKAGPAISSRGTTAAKEFAKAATDVETPDTKDGSSNG